MTTIVLASTSQSRQMLMQRLKIPFIIANPGVDETPLINEQPNELVMRLAREKSQAVAQAYPNALVIGSDQVGVCENQVLGKPLTIEKAISQLTFLSGKKVTFFIGLSLFNTATHHSQVILETYSVYFRQLSLIEIERYVKKDNPLHCAGSFHVEGLGITLIDKLEGDDYTALIGLPLIRLTTLFKNEGIDVV